MVVRQHTTKKLGELTRNRNHVRQNLGLEDELRQLGRSFLERPLHEIIVGPSLEIYDGNRRHAGALLVAGPDAEVPVCITDEPWTESVGVEIQLESDLHTRGLSSYEQYVGASKWLSLNPKATASELAAKIKITPGQLSRLVSLGKCIPAWHEMAAAGRVGIADWVAASRLDPREQHALLELKLQGTSARALEGESRRKRNGNGQPAIKVARVKVTLASGTTINIAGGELGMSDVVEALAETLKTARKAADDGFDVKTWQSMCKDRLKPKEE